ncbi:MAG: hypothetical protein JNM57_12120 [Cyclobacteriaceae bacterium]|nr:hypothetical protein [Cyclobacteriaceae bacterium]
MKKITLFAIASLIIVSSACSFETYSGCPSYSHQNKTTKQGQKAQTKYTKHNNKRNSLL